MYIPDSDVLYIKIDEPGLAEFSIDDLYLSHLIPFFSKFNKALLICLSVICFGNLPTMLNYIWIYLFKITKIYWF